MLQRWGAPSATDDAAALVAAGSVLDIPGPTGQDCRMTGEPPANDAAAEPADAADPADAPESAGAADHGRQLRRSLISLAILAVMVVALLAAVPGLQGVTAQLKRASPEWIAAAIGLEIASNVGYVLATQLVLYRAPRVFAARLAWSESAFGAAVSVGGIGSVALGAWVLTAAGMPKERVAERSAVLFLLTSAVNVIVLTVTGALLAVGVLDGPSNPLLSVLPAAVGATVLLFFLLLPRWLPAFDAAAERGEPGTMRRRLTGLLRGTTETIVDTRRLLTKADWRVVGAYAYLLCDIGVLWASFRAFGPAPPAAALILAYQIGYLANAIPIPGGIGALDFGLIGMLSLYGSNVTTATAAVLIYHAIALWVPALIGTVAYVLLRRSLTRPIVLRPEPAAPGEVGDDEPAA